jgi:hypothetical protein
VVSACDFISVEDCVAVRVEHGWRCSLVIFNWEWCMKDAGCGNCDQYVDMLWDYCPAMSTRLLPL